jgi:hypothetical protein
MACLLRRGREELKGGGEKLCDFMGPQAHNSDRKMLTQSRRALLCQAEEQRAQHQAQ